jgi:hypothetical protein
MDTMIPPWQHGFRPNKGISSAIMDIVEQVYSQPDCSIFEFDLKGWFNNVKWGPTCKLLEKRSKLLAHTLSILLTQLRYRITGDLKDETELYQDTVPVEVRSKNKTRLLPLILRKGMPQGLPFSPVLSSIALSGTKPPKGLVMYADDGVMIVRGKEHFSQFERWTERIFTIGAYIAPEKSKFVNLRAGETFKFLGVTLDLMVGKLHYQGATFHFLKELNMEKNMIRLDNWLRAQNVTYADRINNASKGKPWYWYIREDSVAKAVFQPWKPSIMFEKAYTYIVGILFDRSYKGYRFFYGDPIAPSTSWGIYDVLSLSSDSIGYIVDHKSELKLKKRRPLNIEVGDLSEFFQSQMVPKKGYVDIWDGNMPMHLAADEYVEEWYNQLEGFRAD